MLAQMEGITFTAVLNKAQTTVDGGWRITLDCDQSQVDAILKLTEFRETAITVACVPHPKGEANARWTPDNL